MNTDLIAKAVALALDQRPPRKPRPRRTVALCAQCGHDKHLQGPCTRVIWRTMYTKDGKPLSYEVPCRCIRKVHNRG